MFMSFCGCMAVLALYYIVREKTSGEGQDDGSPACHFFSGIIPRRTEESYDSPAMSLRRHAVLEGRGRRMRQALRKASRYFILFMVISFLGWAVETIFFLFCYGSLYDRGFMTLPFCTIYGFSFLLLYFLIGIPGTDDRGLLPGWPRGKVIYFLLSALIPTGLELVTGYFFHQVFGLRLWSYAAYRFHFHGYICLEYTLLWGILIPLCMRYLFVPLRNRVFAIPAPYVRILSASLALLAIMDWGVNFSRQELVALAGAIS